MEFYYCITFYVFENRFLLVLVLELDVINSDELINDLNFFPAF